MSDANRSRWISRAVWLVVLLGVAGIVGWVLTPRPVEVEASPAVRGPLAVTIEQQGEVRVHDRFNVSTPVAGVLTRVDLHQGDAVKQGQPVATLRVTPLDPRQRDQARARSASARGLAREAEASLEKARVELDLARANRQRTEKLVAEKFVSSEAAETTRSREASAERAVAAATARLDAARADARAAEAALEGSEDGSPRAVTLVAPVAGSILRLVEQSERTLPAGTTVMVIGDPKRFEIVADVLSTDAVRIRAGNAVRLDRWGGDRPLEARVRLVEPYAYTKVSALGVEEKRVDVWMEPLEPLAVLGDGYRVEARIVVWSAADVLKVPASAVYRQGDAWRVFVVEDGRARTRTVTPGERSSREVQIVAGLEAGALVVEYPPNQLADGLRVHVRKR